MSTAQVDREGEDALGIHDDPDNDRSVIVEVWRLREAFATVRHTERARVEAREHLSANDINAVCLYFADGTREWHGSSMPPRNAIEIHRPAPVPVEGGPLSSEYALVVHTFIREARIDTDPPGAKGWDEAKRGPGPLGRRFWTYREVA